MPDTGLLRAAAALLRARWAQLKDHGDAGYTTETVVVIALLVTLAITVIGIIAAKVITKASSLNLG